ncbi:NUDIX hydrolase [Devosia nitrariae]|uniref:NUDIX pyrophosphatase n=1 Tax=Devosia nitrariae TaxID=2071872 RepID=A0ABQ5WBD2_9HYPH|nr:NUDIX domain-containing protein [Devosia nitrariae]GLQ57183.1 NUDIX pyrophosphatase [Devosia nitrariae]
MSDPANRRAPFQVLVLPFRLAEGGREYGLFRRSDSGEWQGIAGGGDEGEAPLIAAGREMEEESGLPRNLPLLPLDTIAMVPRTQFQRNGHWGPEILVVPEFSFGVDATHSELVLSHEHGEAGWFPLNIAIDRLNWDSNRTALWELDQRLQHQVFRPRNESAPLSSAFSGRFWERWR